MSLLFRRRRRQSQMERARSHTLLELNKRDRLTLADGFENIAIFGGVGSGKTSGSGFNICKSMLLHGLGGLVLTAKPGEAARWRRLCQLTRRTKDLIIVDDASDFQFNFLSEQLRLFGRSGSGIENLVTALDATMKVAERATQRKSSAGMEQFWDHGIRKHARAIISLIVHATGGISVGNIVEVMREMPRTLAQAESSEWRSRSLIASLIAIARSRASDESTLHDIEQVENYFLKEFPAISDKTRSIFEAGLYGILDLLARGSLYWMFGRGTNVTPAVCEEGKILVIDWPVSTHGAIGLIAQTLFKLSFQNMVQQRQGEDCAPLFLFADEFQELVTASDYRHAALSRESRTINIWMTQSINSLLAALGADDSGRAACDALLGMANYKIFHANGDSVTNTWAAESIGKRVLLTRGVSVQHPPHRLFQLIAEEPGFSTSTNESIEYVVMPHVFTALKRGGPPHMKTDIVVFASGRTWKSTGESFLFTSLKQGF